MSDRNRTPSYVPKTRQSFARIMGLPAKPVHFMQVQQLLNRKGQNHRVREKMLFHSNQSYDDLAA
jgi:hypothetical protein